MKRAEKTPAINPTPGRVEQLPIAALLPDSGQPRKSFDDKSLQALADSIRARGIMQPILVRSMGPDVPQMIVDGERRWRAAQLAGLETVPAIRINAPETLADLRVDQVTANNLREQLTAMEQARFLRGLRDSGSTVNDIAATLEKHGVKALGRKEIEARLLLTDLPDWAQELIDAGTLETAAAPAILRGMKIPGIEHDLRKRIRRTIDWSGRAVAREIWNNIASAAGDKHTDLTETESYHRNPVHFDHRKRCNGCEHYQAGRGFAVCTDAKLFAAHQTEAKAAGLGPGGKRPEPEHVAEGRQETVRVEQRERSIEQSAREYLHRYLLKALDQPIETDYQLAFSLVLWAAARYPGAYGAGSTPPRIREMFDHERAAAVEDRWDGLRNMLRDAADLGDLGRPDDVRLIARQVKDSCDLDHMILLARHVWGADLAAVWKMDAAYPKLFRKAELAHQLVQCGAPLPDGQKPWESLKTGELQASLIANAERIGVPQILRDIYSEEIISVRRALRDGDDADDDTECDDTDDAA